MSTSVIKDAERSEEPLGIAVYGSTNGYGRYADIAPNTTVRDEFNRRDYEDFRRGESLPTEPKDVMAKCFDVCKNVGLVFNIINLMTDFTIQGITLKHPQPASQKIYSEWWDKVNGFDVSERFVRMLYKTGVAPVSRDVAKFNKSHLKSLRDGLIQGAKKKKNKDFISPEKIDIDKNVIPFGYKILNPLSIDILGGELAEFAGFERYGIIIPENVSSKIKKSTDKLDKEIISTLSEDLVRRVKKGEKVIPLDPSRTRVFFYKKDDDERWPTPILQPIIPDIIHLEKIRLADMVALDGAIRSIRLWKIGDVDNKIAPTREQMQSLAEALSKQVAGGSMDLIWGPAITFEESKSNLYEFLGSEKYESCLNAIYAGLGIPPTLTGAATAAGFTNNYISLKTLLERLSYVRNLLIEFWEHEIVLFQKALGLQKPAKLEFDRMTLSDDAAEKALLIQLADRGIIDNDTLLERFKEDPDLVNFRNKVEEKKRESGRLPKKLSPYIKEDPNALTEGGTSKIGKSGEGRPKNSKDSGRKTKKVKPRVSAKDTADLLIWAKNTQQQISEVVDPIWLKMHGKKNLRMLSDKETEEVEDYKFALLCSISPGNEISNENITNMFGTKPSIPDVIKNLSEEVISKLFKRKSNITIDDIRLARASVYSLYFTEQFV